MLSTVNFSALKRPLIVLFCFWHMAAVAIFVMPTALQQTVIGRARASVYPWIAPYMFVTSQWQQWNLFSPNPLRKVTNYVLQAKTGGRWKDIADFNRSTIQVWRRADELKILRTIEDKNKLLSPIAERFLREQCARVAVGTSLRLIYRSYVLPPLLKPLPPVWWRTYVPEKSDVPGAITRCPPLARK